MGMRGGGRRGTSGTSKEDALRRRREIAEKYSSGESLAKPGAKKDGEGKDGERDLRKLIMEEMHMDVTGTTFESIAGCVDAKRLLNEAIVLPMVRPDFFTGIRAPVKGVLLFGPPGTGKTMLAKAVASLGGSTFFNCTSSSLVSKFRGDSERLVVTLFEVAREHAPSVIFIDEVDALASARGASDEHEASRRLKTQLLTQMDGCGTGDERVLVLAASNHPWDLDEAFRRRLEKRIHIPLPDAAAREALFKINCRELPMSSDFDPSKLGNKTEGYSGADIHLICRDAAMVPVRELVKGRTPGELRAMHKSGELRKAQVHKKPIKQKDFEAALAKVQPSVNRDDLSKHDKWMTEFGAF